MKNFILLILSLLSLPSFAQNKNFVEFDLEVYQHLNTSIKTKNNAPAYIVFLNFNDCINCNAAMNLFNSENPNASNTYFIFDGIPEFKIKSLLNEWGLADSVNTINDEVIKKFFQSTFKKIGKRSTVLYYSNSIFATYTPLKDLVNKDVLESFFANSVLPEKIFQLNDSNFFYSKINYFVPFKNKYLAITSPKGDLIEYNGSFKAVKKFTVDTTFIKNELFEGFVSRFPDSIRVLNSFSEVLKSYSVDIKPLGLDIVSVNDISIKGNKVYLSIYISLPITKSKTKVTFESLGYILELNENLDIVDHKQYNFKKLHNKYLPVSMYGFYVDTNETNTFNMALTNEQVRYNDTVYRYTDTVKIIGRWKAKSDKYIVDYSYKSPYFIDSEIKNYLLKYQDLAIKHSYINDTLLYFRYMPKILNIKTNEVITLISEDKITFNGDGYPLYNCLYAELHPVTKQLFCIERINNQIFLSNFNNTYNRVSMYPVDLDIGNNIIPFKKGETLYVNYTDSKKGAFVKAFSFSSFK